jgi:putative lipoic acid-binding regulatory protein
MTAQLPNLELIEATHRFPCSYTFKVIGDSRSDFTEDALNLTLTAIGEDRELSHTSRNSATGIHTAITISVHLKNADEVHAIYSELLKLNGLRALF